MTIAEALYYTATLVLIVTGVVVALVGWRLNETLIALTEVLSTTKQTLMEIKETPKRIQSNFINSALNIARFIWGRR
jgi:hypothetical protein